MACIEIVFTSFLALFLFMQEDGSLVTLEEKTHWWISNPSKGLHKVIFTGQTFPPSEQRDSSKNKDHLELRDFQFPSPGAVFNLQFSISCIIDRERRGMAGAAECTARWDGGEQTWNLSKNLHDPIFR